MLLCCFVVLVCLYVLQFCVCVCLIVFCFLFFSFVCVFNYLFVCCSLLLSCICLFVCAMLLISCVVCFLGAACLFVLFLLKLRNSRNAFESCGNGVLVSFCCFVLLMYFAVMCLFCFPILRVCVFLFVW